MNTITVQSNPGFQPGDALLIGPNGDKVWITNVTPGNTLTVSGYSLAERFFAWLFL